MRGEGLLPVHGFVLAGGKSSRMGADKATLEFCGRPMVGIAVEKLREFCADVSIAGNRKDLSSYAEVVLEERMDAGPAAGIEAGLKVARQEWALFMPVDVPMVPGELLREWAETVIAADDDSGPCGSYLVSERQSQPAFCLLRKECLAAWGRLVGGGERRLKCLLNEVRAPRRGAAGPVAAKRFVMGESVTALQMERWFSNVNTPEELTEVESRAAHMDSGDGRY